MNLALRTRPFVSLGKERKESDFRAGIGLSFDWTNPAISNITYVLETGPGENTRISTLPATDLCMVNTTSSAESALTHV
jgi:hypothetical protein